MWKCKSILLTPKLQLSFVKITIILWSAANFRNGKHKKIITLKRE